ncbi:LysM peptidoglycan-binding domain-containing protein [Tenacibaculum sp. SG-28]|uniref:PBP1 and LysM peptidoglycan-binding domain-containing protein n=1 Tax=Tenacibaculum sp. SG-28 TaxID=754426 RepID=UPI000CF4E5B6|nr:LysM peptidoglycan-binding domain-containing protein [Tenacibaculum sp. SG-28]PQJ21083.1 hypothetical protein BSU00_08710 [Tenacibaculum sp. SG-28]
MRKLQFLIVAGVLSFTISCGQQKRYISYKVQEGETIAEIAKRLQISEGDLLRLNPDINASLEGNYVIVIPNPAIAKSNLGDEPSYAVVTPDEKDTKGQVESTDEDATSTEEEEVYETTVITNYETHEVQAGETVYRITKMYGISKTDLMALNPEYPGIKSNTLSIGQVLKVKANRETITLNKKEIVAQFVTHEVQPKETVYSITRFYNISKPDLVALNPEYPEIQNDAISAGQLLKIKRKDADSTDENRSFYQDVIAENTSINVAFLLPFKATEYDTLAPAAIFKKNTLANMVTDFYLGATIAMDSIRTQGISVNESVFDTGNRGNQVERILAEDRLDAVDVVIGPFYSDKVSMVTKKVDVPVIFPHFSSKQSNLSSSKLVKAAPEKKTYAAYLTAYLKENYQGETIFVVGDNKTNSKSIGKEIVADLKKHDSIGDIHVLNPKDGYIKKSRFTEKMSITHRNWIIITAENEVAIADALNSMIGLPEGVTVQVFAIHKSKGYDKIDNNKLAAMDFTYVAPYFADENSPELNAFYKTYRVKNNALPSEYAIRGFDVTYDILMRMASGNELSSTFKDGVSFRLENKFDYRKKMFGAATNTGLFIIQYNPDLSLRRLK